MDEILYELREHSAGLNGKTFSELLFVKFCFHFHFIPTAGRWDYIFSCIKKFQNRKDFVLADRHYITMNSPFMRAYALLLIKTCHKRGACAMGGMRSVRNFLVPHHHRPLKSLISAHWFQSKMIRKRTKRHWKVFGKINVAMQMTVRMVDGYEDLV